MGNNRGGVSIKQSGPYSLFLLFHPCVQCLFILIFKYLMQYLMPFVEHEEYQLPSTCRLHHDNDMFREQEEHKIRADTNEWRCGFCKKSFYAEKYLDQHFDNRHSNLINDVCIFMLNFIALCTWYFLFV